MATAEERLTRAMVNAACDFLDAEEDKRGMSGSETSAWRRGFIEAIEIMSIIIAIRIQAKELERDWRTSDSPEAAAERARFEKEQGQ